MRRLIARVVASLAMLAAGAQCSGHGDTPTVSSASTRQPWSAVVVQPVTPVVLLPGQTVIIIVQLVPINGFIFGGPFFFNTFIGANPNLGLFCPGLLNIGIPAQGPFGTFGAFGTFVPSVIFPISPIGFGACTIPINVGIGGVIPLSIQVTGSPGKSSGHQKRYVVRITRRPAQH
jgi:hypothetical protein